MWRVNLSPFPHSLSISSSFSHSLFIFSQPGCYAATICATWQYLRVISIPPYLEKRMSIHCLESGWIGKCAPLGPRDLPQQGFCTPLPFGLRPQASGCKMRHRQISRSSAYFPLYPSSRQWGHFGMVMSRYCCLVGCRHWRQPTKQPVISRASLLLTTKKAVFCKIWVAVGY